MSASGEVEGSHAQMGASPPLARDGRAMRVISLKFPGSCRSCHGRLTAGMSAWWAKGEPPVCVECAAVGEQKWTVETFVTHATEADVPHASQADGSDPKSPLGKDGQSMRLIALKFASACRVCSSGLDAGSSAYWAKGEPPICVRCGEADGGVGPFPSVSVSDHRSALLESLATDKHINVRLAVAQNVSTPVGALERLAADNSVKVRRAVVENVNVSVGALERLAADRSVNIRLTVAGKANLPAASLERLATETDVRVRRGVAGNVSTPIGVLERLAADEHPGVRQAVAANESTSSGLLARLATDPDLRVRWGVAGNVNTPADALERLATDEHQEVRTAVWSNPQASEEMRVMVTLLDVSADERARRRRS